jgi:hypothetical protein
LASEESTEHFLPGCVPPLDVVGAPIVLPPVPDPVDLRASRVLVVDDVADTGETLRLVAETIRPHVAQLRTAVLYEKPRSVVPCDYVWRTTDRWIDFPWSTLPPLGG